MRNLSFVATIILTLTISGFAQAPSQANYLIERAVELLDSEYVGFATFDLPTLEQNAKTKLQSVCKDLASCDYAQGIPVLDELISNLGDGHTFRMSALRRAEFNANAANQPIRGVGMKYGALPDASALVVTRVLENSPAAKAGLKRGDVLFGANGSFEQFTSYAETIAAIAQFEATASSIEFLLENNKTVLLEPVKIGPWLPSLALKNNVAIITFYQFLTPLVANKVQEYVQQVSAAKAIILDVRGSGGGSAFESIGSAGIFTQPVGTTFESKGNQGRYEFKDGVISSSGYAVWRLNQFKPWKKTVLVLTNKISRSAAEYMTFFLQRAGRAFVIGEKTAGVLNTSTSLYDLPEGSTLAITAGRSSTLDRIPHPEFVTPDIEMLDDMAALSNGRDLILEQAFKTLP
jgi:carboxyl-terminal processing protease